MWDARFTAECGRLCATGAWGAQPELNRPAQGHNLVSDPAESRHQ